MNFMVKSILILLMLSVTGCGAEVPQNQNTQKKASEYVIRGVLEKIVPVGASTSSEISALLYLDGDRVYVVEIDQYEWEYTNLFVIGKKHIFYLDKYGEIQLVLVEGLEPVPELLNKKNFVTEKTKETVDDPFSHGESSRYREE